LRARNATPPLSGAFVSDCLVVPSEREPVGGICAETREQKTSGAKKLVTRSMTLGFCAFLVAAIGGCTPDFSPNTYDSAAVQQANKVDTGVVVGFREVKINVDGTVGAVTGGVAGGILGAPANSPSVPTALAALGGTVVGGVIGVTVEHATGDTKGWEYIVREPKGDLISVTQREQTPIAIGQRVLVIEGKQARIVPDYASTAYDVPPAAPSDQSTAATKASAPGSAPGAPASAPPAATQPAATPAATTTASPPIPAPPSDATTMTGAPPSAAPADSSPPAPSGSGDTAPPAPPPS
jgi:outer membrane lipoprotein SlyB